MNAKEYLTQLKKMDKDIKALKNQIVVLYSKMQGCSSPFGEHNSSTRNISSPQEKNVFKYLDAEEKICIKEKIRDDLEKEITNVINMTSDADVINVLTKRYLAYEEWYDISNEMSYSMSNVFRIHKIGLEKIQTILNDCSRL